MFRINLFAACVLFPLLAATAQSPQPAHEDPKNAAQAILELSGEQQLGDLARALAVARAEAQTLRKRMENVEDKTEKQRLEAELSKLNTQIDELVTSLERVATGSTDLEVFEEQPQEEFNWKRELEEVFEPLLVELKRLTQRPRKIERLRSEQALYEERLEAAEAALESIAQSKAEAKIFFHAHRESVPFQGGTHPALAVVGASCENDIDLIHDRLFLLRLFVAFFSWPIVGDGTRQGQKFRPAGKGNARCLTTLYPGLCSTGLSENTGMDRHINGRGKKRRFICGQTHSH